MAWKNRETFQEREFSGLVKCRLHSQFEADRYDPSWIGVTRKGGGENDEATLISFSTITARTTSVPISALTLKILS